MIAERPRGVEAERLEVAGEHFHRRDAAGLDRRDKFRARGEGKIRAAPEAEALGIGEVLHAGGPRRRDIDDARIGQRVLEPEARASLLRRGLVAALALSAAGVRHGVAFVEDDDAIEIRAEPVDDLLHARRFLGALVGAQRGVGRKENALAKPDRRSLAKARERRHQKPLHAERRPVALGVLDQRVGFRDPDGAAAALQPIVEEDAGDLPALAGAGAVAEKPAAAEADGVRRVLAAAATTSKVASTVQAPARWPACASPA